MSADKPSGGDRRPDQTPRPEHRPFPGQPDNRPHLPPPTGTKTADQMRAERAKYKTNSEYEAAKAAERAATRQAGALPGGTPARGDGGRSPAVSPDRGSAPRPDAPGTRRPDGLARPDRTRARPFPGQPDNRPPVPPPTGTKTADAMRAERAKFKTNSEYEAAKAAERAAARQAAADSGPGEAVKESTAAKPGAGTAPERSARVRDKDRTDSGRAEDSTAPARDSGVFSDWASATQAASRDPGDGKHLVPAAQPGKTSPDFPAARQGDKGGILHVHSEFHGQDLDLYTEGTRWVGGDAVRAARAEAARARAEGQPAPQLQGITDISQMRDLGRNTVGEKEDRSPGDTSDLPPTGQGLVDEANEKGAVKDRLLREVWEEGDDAVDVLQNNVDDGHDNFIPQPTGSHEGTAPQGPYFAAQPHGVADVGTGATALLVLGLAIERSASTIMEHWRRHSKGDI